MIRTIRPLDRPDPALERVAKANGFSLHAGVSGEGHQKDKRERLCRYIARPAVAVPRLSLSSTGKVLYTLKTPYRDGEAYALSVAVSLRMPAWKRLEARLLIGIRSRQYNYSLITKINFG